MERGGNEGAFSDHRLNGEPVPDDVKKILRHTKSLFDRWGIELNWDDGWAPWLDMSYLTEADRSNPDIMANVRAIADVCGLIAFIAARDEGEYYGYWRGPSMRPVADTPLVLLDSEGQFELCGSTFAEAVLRRTSHDEQAFSEARDWLKSLGIAGLPESLEHLACPRDEPSPDALHKRLYHQYLGPASGA
jgi:hypothetical protein